MRTTIAFYYKKTWWDAGPYNKKAKELTSIKGKPLYRPGMWIQFTYDDIDMVGKIMWATYREGSISYEARVAWSHIDVPEDEVIARMELVEG